MKYRKEFISPKMAEKLLAKNTINRNIIDSWVDRLANRLTESEFVLSPDPICIGENGEIYNGQHRLWAVVLSGIGTEFFVYRDCDASVLKTIDAGRPRTFHDLITIQKLSSGREKTSTLYTSMVRGFFGLPEEGTSGGTSMKNPAAWNVDLYMQAEIKVKPYIDFVYDRIIDSHAPVRLTCAPAMVAVARAYACEVPVATIDGFLKKYFWGKPSEIRSEEVDAVVQKIRDKFIRDPVGPSGWQHRQLFYLMMAGVLQCFDVGRSPKSFRIPSQDPFPLSDSLKKIEMKLMIPKPDRSARKEQKEILQKAS